MTCTLSRRFIGALLALPSLLGCASDDAGAPTDTAGSDTAGDTGATVNGCAEADLEACDYPRRGLSFRVVEGGSVEDEITGRTLPALARVPEGQAGPLPVVIWSHGGGFNDGGHNSGVEWSETLARQGYVVIHIAHVNLTADTGRTICELAQVPTAECIPTGEDDDTNGLLAVVRSYDLRAVLRKLSGLSAWSVDHGGPALDLDRVAVAGWSGGSRAPVMMLGGRVLPTAGSPVFTNPDPLPKAAVTLSPTGPGFGGFFDTAGDHSWEAMRGPTLAITGANDVKPNKTDLTGPVRRTAYDLQPNDGARRLLYSNLPVPIGGHGTYNLEGLDDPDPRVVRLSRAVRAAVLAFLDAELDDDDDARAWLASDNAHVLAGDAEWAHH